MAKVNGGGLSGPAAGLTGVEVAIGTEPLVTAVFVALIAESGRLTATCGSFEVVRGRPREFNGRGSRGVQRRDGGIGIEREVGKQRKTEKPDERNRMIWRTVQRSFFPNRALYENNRYTIL